MLASTLAAAEDALERFDWPRDERGGVIPPADDGRLVELVRTPSGDVLTVVRSPPDKIELEPDGEVLNRPATK